MSKHECAYCGERFEKPTDLMSHVVSKHDTGYKRRNERIVRRSSSCWSCAAEIPPTATHCACGALHPRFR